MDVTVYLGCGRSDIRHAVGTVGYCTRIGEMRSYSIL